MIAIRSQREVQHDEQSCEDRTVLVDSKSEEEKRSECGPQGRRDRVDLTPPHAGLPSLLSYSSSLAAANRSPEFVPLRSGTGYRPGISISRATRRTFPPLSPRSGHPNERSAANPTCGLRSGRDRGTPRVPRSYPRGDRSRIEDGAVTRDALTDEDDIHAVKVALSDPVSAGDLEELPRIEGPLEGFGRPSVTSSHRTADPGTSRRRGTTGARLTTMRAKNAKGGCQRRHDQRDATRGMGKWGWSQGA